MVDDPTSACPTTFGQEPPPAMERRAVLRVQQGKAAPAEDALADEVPVALVYNGISHAVMMATPADLEDFALGFSLTEALIDHPGECYGIEVEAGPAGVAVQLEIASRAFVALKERRRSLAGRTGCGLCGVDSLDQVYRTLPPRTGKAILTGAAVRAALAALPERQALNQLTGATHAAAWCDLAGRIAAVREDVGRHNALDKVAGALARDPGLRMDDGFVLVTSRVSVEMVQKAAMAGAAGIVGVSAPTAAAVRMAAGAGLVLLAFARGDRFTCYAGQEQVTP
ncbi:formate dehydrogenase accessory sulfurtransferase FdhD [Pseudoduganella umbonata]|uniref:Sulfur carrier protein FdhD n=1 Tax=Pseudoduganella umbonata TaxID=864828 RepID=A0A4P8HKX7_9BURK|nr:formate dehydrogenase accessory sulfurtransferase FdhD [Pseudoduganella umbonata]MBB3219472.1 FdhD protein [Pseudoduganella umbonata]QCP09556.1 formate dehydrogenase accessory sulfurtransferase FdhD [Pseudoduganella umbonata]